MEDKRFDQTVRIGMHGKPNVSIPIRTALEAAEQLLQRDDWPTSAAKNHMRARKACLDVLEGLRDAREARLAFEAAAKDAGFLRPPAEPPKVATDETKMWRGRRYRLKRDL